MKEKPLSLWFAYPGDVLAGSVIEARAQLLGKDERERWESFRFEEQRREYLTTRALVRCALSHHHPLPPEAWRFQLNSYGKPAIYPDFGLRFNLSNSPGLVVCLIAQKIEVGVDAEPFDRAAKIAEVGGEVFSSLEITQLEALRGREQLDCALSLWTLKESYIKARGIGLSLPLQEFSFLLGGSEGVQLKVDPRLDDNAGRWRFCLLNQAKHRIALAVEHMHNSQIQRWEARPLVAAPRALPSGGERWYPASTQLS
jgi:4'-phosphopantetheinyl transferase